VWVAARLLNPRTQSTKWLSGFARRLLVLEMLGPTERAVFGLREVFDLEYDKIAEAVDKSPAAVRQIAYRARAQVAARRPRGIVSPAQTRAASRPSNGRSIPATCRACSTSSRRTSSP
jgi:hypothetical protein